MTRLKQIIFVVCALIFANANANANDTSNHLSVAQIKRDLTQLYNDLKSSHIDLFANITKDEYDAQFTLFMQSIKQPKTTLQAHIFFQKFIALGKVAHATIGFPNDEYTQYRDNGGLAFPIYVKINESSWRVSENYSGQDIPTHAEITHINDIPVDVWFDRILEFISADTSAIAASLLEFQLPQYLWLIGVEQDKIPAQYDITVLNDKVASTYTIAALDRETLQANIDKAYVEAASEKSLREFKMLSTDIAYLKPGPFYHAENSSDVWDNTSFVAFIDDAFTQVLKNNASKLLIDVRENPGGSNSFSDPLIAWYADKPFKFASEFIIRSSMHAQTSNAKRLEQASAGMNTTSKQLAKSYEEYPHGTTFSFLIGEVNPRKGKQFEGEVYVLIDRSSYSNAVSLAAITKDYGFGTLIGEATTDFATTLASMENFTLQESKIEVGFPKARIVRPSGNKKPGPVYPDIKLDSFELEHIVDALKR